MGKKPDKTEVWLGSDGRKNRNQHRLLQTHRRCQNGEEWVKKKSGKSEKKQKEKGRQFGDNFRIAVVGWNVDQSNYRGDARRQWRG